MYSSSPNEQSKVFNWSQFTKMNNQFVSMQWIKPLVNYQLDQCFVNIVYFDHWRLSFSLNRFSLPSSNSNLHTDGFTLIYTIKIVNNNCIAMWKNSNSSAHSQLFQRVLLVLHVWLWVYSLVRTPQLYTFKSGHHV